MTSVRGLRQRARDRAGVLARPFPLYVGARVCLRCRTTTSHVSSHAYAAHLRGAALRCSCGGRVLPAYDTRLIELLTLAAETRLAELLTLDANRLHPDESAGLDRIRNRVGGAPLAGGTAADDDLGSQPS